MNADSFAAVDRDQNTSTDFRRLFFAHVFTVVLTAALVAPLLLGVTSIPSWFSVGYCTAIAMVAFAFVVVAIHSVRNLRGIGVANRIQRIMLTLGLSMLQVIFILPVLICIFAPTFRA